MSFTKPERLWLVTAAICMMTATGCRQFKAMVNEEPKPKTEATAKAAPTQNSNENTMLQSQYLNEVEKAELEAFYGNREADHKARRQRVFGF